MEPKATPTPTPAKLTPQQNSQLRAAHTNLTDSDLQGTREDVLNRVAAKVSKTRAEVDAVIA